MFNTKKSQKGISLLFVVLIMSVILSIGIGISGILIQQTKMMGEIGYSVVSFYAADSGIERQLFDLYKTPPEQLHQSQYIMANVGNNVSFTVNAKCGASVSSEKCLPGLSVAAECNAANVCIKSTGAYKETRRAIEIKY